jgi:hypothetical protein
VVLQVRKELPVFKELLEPLVFKELLGFKELLVFKEVLEPQGLQDQLVPLEL